MKLFSAVVVLASVLAGAFIWQDCSSGNTEFPTELVSFKPAITNPVFSGTGEDTWDQVIRERGWILKEGATYHLWYTGYKNDQDEKHLGYATSPDGIEWTRFPGNPIYDSAWVEDMSIVKYDGTYYMFAEGRGDSAHLLTSVDKVHWKEQGMLDIRHADGTPLSPGPFGTPSIWLENGIWYLFYERNDLGIWLATSTDLKVWTNSDDYPVITTGPEIYDQFGVAMDQVIKYNGKYYGYYHATEFKDWHEWTSCVAVSDDLIHWKKYEKNPILRENKSSPILLEAEGQFRLYSMHPSVAIHSSTKPEARSK